MQYSVNGNSSVASSLVSGSYKYYYYFSFSETTVTTEIAGRLVQIANKDIAGQVLLTIAEQPAHTTTMLTQVWDN